MSALPAESLEQLNRACAVPESVCGLSNAASGWGCADRCRGVMGGPAFGAAPQPRFRHHLRWSCCALQRLHQVHQQVQHNSFQWPDERTASRAQSRRQRISMGSCSALKSGSMPIRAGGASPLAVAAPGPLPIALSQASGSPRPEPADRALLEQVLESYPLASRSRQQCGLVLSLLARHEQCASSDWNERAAGYGLHQARFRQLPE